MLQLSRHVGEEVILTVPPSDTPTVIRVAVQRAGLSLVKLGFDAPHEVVIMRDNAKCVTRVAK